MTVKFFKHPEYSRRFPEWEIYRDLLAGEHDTLKGIKYLWEHEFEEVGAARQTEDGRITGGARLRAIRELRSRYTNYLKAIVRRYCALVFKNEIDTDPVAELFGDALEDVDGAGHSFTDFLRDVVAPTYFSYGKAGIVTDSFNAAVPSRAAEAELNIRPFWEALEPLTLTDWGYAGSFAQYSKLMFARTEFTAMAERAAATEEPAEYNYSTLYQLSGNGYEVIRYRGAKKAAVLTDDQGSQWEEVDRARIADVGSIPIALVDGESWLKECSDKAIQLYNLESALDYQLNFQCYQRIIGSGPFTKGEAIAMNEAGITLLPEGFSVTAIEPTNPAALIQRISGVAATLFQLAFSRTRLLPADAKGVEGADTQRESKEDFLACLKSAGKALETLVNKGIKDWAAFKRQPNYDREVSLNLELTIEDWDQIIGSATAFYTDIKTFPTWYKSLMKRIATQQNLDELDEILEEIENAKAPGIEEPKPETGEAFGEAMGLNGSGNNKP